MKVLQPADQAAGWQTGLRFGPLAGHLANLGLELDGNLFTNLQWLGERPADSARTGLVVDNHELCISGRRL